MTTTRNDIKKLSQTIEALAKELQDRVDSGSDLIGVSNDMVRNTMTFVFALGELYNAEQKKVSVKTVKATAVKSSPSRTYARDALGRFANKLNAVSV